MQLPSLILSCILLRMFFDIACHYSIQNNWDSYCSRNFQSILVVLGIASMTVVGFYAMRKPGSAFNPCFIGSFTTKPPALYVFIYRLPAPSFESKSAVVIATNARLRLQEATISCLQDALFCNLLFMFLPAMSWLVMIVFEVPSPDEKGGGLETGSTLHKIQPPATHGIDAIENYTGSVAARVTKGRAGCWGTEADCEKSAITTCSLPSASRRRCGTTKTDTTTTKIPLSNGIPTRSERRRYRARCH
ncbi:unnamed protein product [Soboliphyme baturini]|uniref:G_PROTEIN_RECEP_F3_4 domain-containing protein n=1 Tax=Soboliphyme baturini TaxID=241478 RepID=A0A183J8A2_9BILA|nr:unnamed protein product [Soboliphyme baturini]